ncbi:MAG: hypothetical protein ABIJ97_17715, partial [Bacteroidota bacterium]
MKKTFILLIISCMAFSIKSQINYSVIQIPHQPVYQTSGISVPFTSDDEWSNSISLPFNFMFFGQPFDQVIIGENGVLSFDLTDASGYCPWSFTTGVPNNFGSPIHILGAFHDLYCPAGGYVKYSTEGTSPCREFVVTYNNAAQFSCNSIYTTQHIILYESSNCIDVVIDYKPVCTSWNGGNAIVGIQNFDQTVGYAAPGRNPAQWVALNEAWRFIPDGSTQTCEALVVSNFSLIDTLHICYGDELLFTLANDSNALWYENGNLFYTGLQPPNQTPLNDVEYVLIQSDTINSFYDTLYVIVDQPPLLEIFGLENYYCINDSVDTLIVTPSGALISGPGIFGNIFDPAVADTGQHTITASYFNTIPYNFIGPEIFWVDDFSTDKGWTGYGNAGWERNPAIAGTGCSGLQDPDTDNSPSSDNYIVGTNIGGCYSTIDTVFWLESPVIDCSGKNNCYFRFYENSGFAANDTAQIAVFDGTDWIVIDSIYNGLDQYFWMIHQYDVSSYADNNPLFKVKFGIGPCDTIGFYKGWNLDDITFLADDLISTTKTCTYESYYNVYVDSTGEMQNICMVTVDPASQKNTVIWEKTDPNIDNYYIYKETIVAGVYNLIGVVPTDSAGIYIDDSSNPGQQSDKYKLSAIDRCGNVSDLGNYHKTIHLNVSPALPQGYALTWQHYEGFLFDTYVIYRGSSPV